MKRIGDVLANISIPIGPSSGGATSEESYRCEKCKDAGYIRYPVPLGHPKFGQLIPCECRSRDKEARRSEELLRLSNLGVFHNHRFEDFEPGDDDVNSAYQIARAYAEDPQGWLFLQGGCGVGKTHLAVAIALHVIETRSASVLFTVVPDLLDHLRSTFGPNVAVDYDKRFDDVRNAWLLILDDLGTENTTPWAREKLYQIFNHRYNEQLPTVITSNRDFGDIDDRVLSRLLDTRLNRYVNIDAEDFRTRDFGFTRRPRR
jgi:DNA replication protein DnaC